ncbi:immunity 8 family protein [Klebsiella electrica]|uniref:immunity 8 family protein n=1 Tax=Klebsiella electrica TaxID=1259973 RepID=UPI002552BB7F|nr:immunity 8 family protein [Klebsiella electrica]WIO45214.1 immunity 8 family protein [Klebsiella electrica]
MKALLKELRSLEIEDDLINYWPEDPEIFGSWVRAMVGPDNEEGAECFDILICTPKWLQNKAVKNNIFLGKGMIIINVYDYDKIITFVKKQIADCHADTWSKIAQKLSRFSFWEYEDYQHR